MAGSPVRTPAQAVSSTELHRQHCDPTTLTPRRVDPADRLVLLACLALAVLMPFVLALEGGVA